MLRPFRPKLVPSTTIWDPPEDALQTGTADDITRSASTASDDNDAMALDATVNFRGEARPVSHARRQKMPVSLLHSELAHDDIASRAARDGAVLEYALPDTTAFALPVVAKGHAVTLETTGSG